MNLSVLTVTYNSEKFIKGYLDSVLKFLPTDGELIIVDSGSQDKTVEVIKKYSTVANNKKFTLIESPENINFGRGNNLAAQKAQGEFLFILNPDTKLSQDPFSPLLKFAQNQTKVGITAPKLVEENGQDQPSVRKLPTIWGAIQEYWFGVKNAYEAYVPSGQEPVEIESVVGAAMLIPKQLFLKLGGFDKKYTAYFEDLDLCRSVKKAGFKIYYLPEVKLFHAVGGSVNEMKQKWLVESAKKYHGLLNYLILYFILRTHNIAKRLLGK